MSAREEILNKVRAAVKGGDDRQALIEERLTKSNAGLQPYSGTKEPDLVEKFLEKAVGVDATAETCKKGDVEDRIIDFLRRQNVPLSVRMGDNPALKDYEIGKHKMLDVRTGPSDGTDLAAVSSAFGGIAETGTLALASGSENPTTLNFLPENHIVVLKKSDIAMHQEDIWTKLRKTYGKGKMPRTLNFITGPSRSGDIEQTLILGAHGPIRLHILVVE